MESLAGFWVEGDEQWVTWQGTTYAPPMNPPPSAALQRKETDVHLLRITHNYTCILHAYNCNGPARQPSPEVVGQHIHSVSAGSPPGGKVASVASPPGGPSPGWDATPLWNLPGPPRAAQCSACSAGFGYATCTVGGWVDRGSAVWYGRRVE